MKKIIQGTTAKLFALGLVLLIIGGVLYGRSEQLGGVENIQKGKNLEIAGGIIFLSGFIAWVFMFAADGMRGKKN
jgi:hypothetical protein